MSKQVPSRKVETITSNEDQVRFEIFSGALPISEAAAELLRVEKCQHEAERRRHRDSVERLSAEIAGLQDENKMLREALEFYRDPVAWKKLYDPDDDVRVPDFYSELCFGDTAEAALLTNQQLAANTVAKSDTQSG